VNLNITAVKCRSFHRRAPPFLPVVYDIVEMMMSHHVHTQTDRTTNLSISNVLLQCSLRSPWRRLLGLGLGFTMEPNCRGPWLSYVSVCRLDDRINSRKAAKVTAA